MIIDSHCHAWQTWPYQPPVPDPESRGRIEQLLYEMDACGVDRAAIVCANIDHNPDNNGYIAEEVRKRPDRFYQIADVDSFWSSTYHTPGAAQRLAEAAERWPLAGFTHYLDADDDGAWLAAPQGMEFFAVAAEQRLVASVFARPHQLGYLRQVAEAHPTVPILLHHLGFISPDDPAPQSSLAEILRCAESPAIYVKVSGFYYSAKRKVDYPYLETHWIVRSLHSHFGPRRLCWGSDYPVVRPYMTYQQALDAVRQHCSFIPPADLPWIMGDNLHTLLEARQPA